MGQEFEGAKDEIESHLPRLNRPSINHGDTTLFREMYILLVDPVSEVHYDPNFDWARHLPSAVPLDRRSHDR